MSSELESGGIWLASHGGDLELLGPMLLKSVLNQGDQGENLIPPSLILIPDTP